MKRYLSTTAAVVALVLELALLARRGFALPIPKLPRPLAQILEQSGVLRGDGPDRLLGDWQAIFQPPARNAEFADLMERARQGDVVVALTDDLLAPEVANAGLGGAVNPGRFASSAVPGAGQTCRW